MYWIKEMQNAIGFIESRLTEELNLELIARSANSSSANFQRIFSIVTGMTVGDYIRSRRLSLAGKDLAESGAKVIDTAFTYGFETPESFTKAFTRFHGMTPSAAKRQKSGLKYFMALSINVEISGDLPCAENWFQTFRRYLTTATTPPSSLPFWKRLLKGLAKTATRRS